MLMSLIGYYNYYDVITSRWGGSSVPCIPRLTSSPILEVCIVIPISAQRFILMQCDSHNITQLFGGGAGAGIAPVSPQSLCSSPSQYNASPAACFISVLWFSPVPPWEWVRYNYYLFHSYECWKLYPGLRDSQHWLVLALKVEL